MGDTLTGRMTKENGILPGDSDLCHKNRGQQEIIYASSPVELHGMHASVSIARLKAWELIQQPAALDFVASMWLQALLRARSNSWAHQRLAGLRSYLCAACPALH
jgi:hypothetical protein